MIFINQYQHCTTTRLPLDDARRRRSGKRLSPWASLFGLWWVAGMALAAESDEAVNRAIEEHLNAQLKTHAEQQGWHGARLTFHTRPGPVSRPPCQPALRVRSLDEPLSPFSRVRLDVSCPGQGWAQTFTVQPRIFIHAVVARATVERGQPVSQSNLGVEERAVNRPQPGVPGTLDGLPGLVAKRRIRAGQVLTMDLLGKPWLVKRRQRVLIIGQHESIQATALGETLEPGREGDRLRVRNLASHKIIQAQVVDSETVCSTCEK